VLNGQRPHFREEVLMKQANQSFVYEPSVLCGIRTNALFGQCPSNKCWV